MNASGSRHSRSLSSFGSGIGASVTTASSVAAAADQIVRGFGVDELDVEFDVGEALRECLQHRCESVQSDVMTRRHREATVDASMQIAQHHLRIGKLARAASSARGCSSAPASVR